jgi:hypothetical protein
MDTPHEVVLEAGGLRWARRALATMACLWAMGVPGAEASILTRQDPARGPEGQAADARPDGETDTDTWTIVLMIAGEGGTDDPMAMSIRAQLVDLPVELVVVSIDALPGSLPRQHELARSVSVDHGAELVLWFELAAEERLYLYLSEQERASTLMRELSVAGESAAGRAASVAVIVRGVVDALVQGGHLGVEFEEVAARAEEVEAPAEREIIAEPPGEDGDAIEVPRRTLVEVALTAAYGIERFSDAAPAAHAIVLGIDLWLAELLLIDLRYRATFPVRIDDGAARFEITRYPTQLGLRGAGHKGAWDFGGGIVFVLDVIERRGTALIPGVVVSEDRRWVRSAIGPVLQAGWRAHPRIRLWLDVGFDVHFSPVEHFAEAEDRAVLRQYAFRPRGQLGLAVTLGSKKRKAP